MTRTSANLLMLVAGLVWGLGFVAQEQAMDDIGPFLFMGLRFALAALALAPLVLWELRKRDDALPHLSNKDWLSLVTVGVIFFTAMALQQVGLLATSVTNAGVLTGLYVVLTPIILHLFFGQRQPVIIGACAATAFLGIWLLGGGGLGRLTWGDWVMIVGAVFAALHVIIVGATVGKMRLPATLAAMQFAIASLFSWAGFAVVRIADWSYEPALAFNIVARAAPEIAYAALIAGALAFTIMAFCQQYTKAADAAILLSSEALFAALGGAILLGERLDVLGYAGCAILFGAIVVTSFASAKLEERATLT
ncbi:MAG: DMT family transporter [Pseudomonadota bacterium]